MKKLNERGGNFIEREWEFPKREKSFQELGVAYAPQQNGVLERDNKTAVEIIKCILLCRNSALNFWVRLFILLFTS
jgi:hypothetical protein